MVERALESYAIAMNVVSMDLLMMIVAELKDAGDCWWLVVGGQKRWRF